MSRVRSYEDFARKSQEEAEKLRKAKSPVVKCPECACDYFTEVKFNRYLAMRSVVYGQACAQEPSTPAYVLLECGRCGHRLEPDILQSGVDRPGMNRYSDFLSTMEGKDMITPEASASAILSEKL